MMTLRMTMMTLFFGILFISPPAGPLIYCGALGTCLPCLCLREALRSVFNVNGTKERLYYRFECHPFVQNHNLRFTILTRLSGCIIIWNELNILILDL